MMKSEILNSIKKQYDDIDTRLSILRELAIRDNNKIQLASNRRLRSKLQNINGKIGQIYNSLNLLESELVRSYNEWYLSVSNIVRYTNSNIFIHNEQTYKNPGFYKKELVKNVLLWMWIRIRPKKA